MPPKKSSIGRKLKPAITMKKQRDAESEEQSQEKREKFNLARKERRKKTSPNTKETRSSIQRQSERIRLKSMKKSDVKQQKQHLILKVRYFFTGLYPYYKQVTFSRKSKALAKEYQQQVIVQNMTLKVKMK